MDPTRFQQIQDLLAEALDLPEPDRAAFLQKRCQADTELRLEVESLLSAASEAENYFYDLSDRAIEDAADRLHTMAGDPSETAVAHGTIGPYRLLEVIGEGGMGVVWLAEQRVPVRRRVALKIIRTGMNTREALARFQTERQALAMMDHPGIAKVLDGGVTDDGRPFFVMELVHGTPIDKYCDAQRLTTAERVRLFLPICAAVQHAHFKGIVHRDLKPNNILVAVQDRTPVPKIIDFGIAKAIGGALTTDTLVTHQGQFIGTPAYVSPEQAEASGLDVDSRSDIYSLGVLLYQLLIGALPVDLMNVERHSMRAAIRDTEITRPSARLRELGHDVTTIAEKRKTSPDALRRTLKDELDWITLKAMEKDRTRRYETASAMAEDLERYLNDEPVQARAPGASYRVRKFLRRNRIAVAATAVPVVLILAFGVVVSLQARRIARERDRAVQVSGFLEELFEGAE